MNIDNFPKKHPVFLQILIYIVLGASLSGLSGCSHHSSTPFFLPSKVPSATTSIVAVAGDGTLKLQWNPVSSAYSYNVYRSTVSGGPYIKVAHPSSAVYTDKNLTNGTAYYYQISAVNLRGEGERSNELSATPGAGVPGTVVLTVQYQDKEYGVNGFTGNRPYKFVRYATVDLIDATTSAVLSTASTDANGAYTFTGAAAAKVYVRVLAEAAPTGNSQIVIKDLSAGLYSLASADFTPWGPAFVNISATDSSIGGAFNMLDVFTNGILFDDHWSGGSTALSLSGYWKKGNSNGTYYCSSFDSTYCPNGEGIYVLNSSSDTDEYDDDVLYHEFGHFTAQHFSKDDSPGGVHGLTDNDLDLRLAWSEGWGDSFPGAIKMWLNSASPELLSSTGIPLTVYIDTTSSGVGIAIDMDNPDGAYGFNSVYFSYASDEIAIAKILLDLNKDAGFGMQDIWNVVTDFKSNPPATPVNLELFWDRWNFLGNPTTSSVTFATLTSLFADRQIFYYPDGYEPDDTNLTINSIAIGASQVHTLYSAGDQDYIKFTATGGKSYTITTYNLRNGADTYISLFNSDRITLTSNTTPSNPNDNSNGITYSGDQTPSTLIASVCDNWGVCHENGNDVLGSTIVTPVLSAGTYYIKVNSSSTRPVSAGRYGTYSLKITSP